MKPYSSAFAFSYLLSLAIIVSTRHYEENSSNRKLFFKLRGEDQTHQTSRMSRRKRKFIFLFCFRSITFTFIFIFFIY